MNTMTRLNYQDIVQARFTHARSSIYCDQMTLVSTVSDVSDLSSSMNSCSGTPELIQEQMHDHKLTFYIMKNMHNTVQLCTLGIINSSLSGRCGARDSTV
jgi:hypothetical protein